MTSATTMMGKGRGEDGMGTFISLLVTITAGGWGGGSVKGCLRAGGEGKEVQKGGEEGASERRQDSGGTERRRGRRGKERQTDDG